jgi:phospholipid transport system substrate-binding protein
MIRLAARGRVISRRVALLSAAMAMTALTLPVRADDAQLSLNQPLRELYAALNGAMRAGPKTPFAQRFEALAPVVDRVFDLETVLKVSIGLRWDGLDAESRGRLLGVYRRFTIATYVANFDRYDGERFLILPGSRDAGTDRIVGTEIISGGDRAWTM